jgi:ribA/ribD-fused uncharacterized protein
MVKLRYTRLIALLLVALSGSCVMSWGPASAGEVWFHPNTEPYYYFANFYETDGNRGHYPLQDTVNQPRFTQLHLNFVGKTPLNWRSSEHAFQAMKFPTQLDALHSAWQYKTPGDVFRAIRAMGNPTLTAWHNVKLYVMYAALTAKYAQNPDLLNRLMKTGTARIVEHVEINHNQPQGDNYWGDTSGGANYLGKLLMIVRKELTGNAYPTTYMTDMQAAEAELLKHQTTWTSAGFPFLSQDGRAPITFTPGSAPASNPAAPAPVAITQPAQATGADYYGDMYDYGVATPAPATPQASMPATGSNFAPATAAAPGWSYAPAASFMPSSLQLPTESYLYSFDVVRIELSKLVNNEVPFNEAYWLRFIQIFKGFDPTTQYSYYQLFLQCSPYFHMSTYSQNLAAIFTAIAPTRAPASVPYTAQIPAPAYSAAPTHPVDAVLTQIKNGGSPEIHFWRDLAKTPLSPEQKQYIVNQLLSLQGNPRLATVIQEITTLFLD